VWSDGKKFSDSQKPMEQLQSVYNNEITWNESDLNKMIAGQIAYVFQMIKARAK
jgi:L-arabinose isomerase